jgi:HEAT repeat protein
MKQLKSNLPVAVSGLWLLAIPSVLFAQDKPAQAPPPKRAAELLEIIQTKGLTAEKAAAFEELAVQGTAESVGVLAPMLADAKLSHYARFALEANPDPSVDTVFRQALFTLKGDLLIGVVNSIGVRQDQQAIGELEKLLSDPSREVGAAAAAALGAIATPEASNVLRKALANADDQARESIARAMVSCAENMAQAGSLARAAELYGLVRKADVAENVQLAALRGAILTRGAEGIDLMVEQLAAEDLDVVGVALRTARELDRPEVLGAIVAALDELGQRNAALVMLALGDIGDSSVVPVLVKAAGGDATEVRLAALNSLAQVGDASAVPVLWQAALDADPSTAEAAVAALEAIPGEKVDAAIVEGLGSDQLDKRTLALNLIAQRRITAAVPQLIKLASQADGQLRLMAIQALGETAPQNLFPTLVGWVIDAEDEELRETATRALQAACARLPDRDACAQQLTTSLAAAPAEAKTILLEQLGSMGGPDALRCLADCARDSRPETQDAATRILGTWVGADVGPVLLELAQTIQNNKYKIRVLRGYIRIASQFGLPHDEKMDMCKNALAVAQRDDERQLVLTVLERNPSTISLQLAVTLLENPQLKNQAANTVLSIAQRVLVEEPAPVASAMQKVLAAGVRGGLEQRAQSYLDRAKAEIQ